MSDASTISTPLHGPGGLLATPGMGVRVRRKARKWGIRTKDKQIKGNLYRSDTGKFTAGNGPPSSDAPPSFGKVPKKPKGRKRAAAKPKQTPEQHAQAQAAKRAQNAADVAKRMADSDTGLSPSGSQALLAFADGTTPDSQTGAQLAQMGLAEQASDGSYRMTPTGHAAVSAMQSGDYRRALDAISRGTDASGKRTQRAQERTTRQQATQARRAEVAARRAAKQPANGRAARSGDGNDLASAMQGVGQQARGTQRKQRPAKASSGGGSTQTDPQPDAATKRPPTKRRPRSSAPSVGGVGGAAANKKLPPPPKAPAKQIAPALQEAAQQLSERAPGLTGAALDALVRNGLARVTRDGPVLTASGLRATMKAQTDQEKAAFANMGGGGSGGSGGKGGKKSGGSGGLWNKGPDGKRVPQAGFASPKRTPSGGEGKARAADPGKPAHGQTSGNLTKAYGADPNQSYTMRHELVDMGSIQASNTAGGGINPHYDPSLQPRDRSRASSQAQIADVAQKMNPDVLTTDFHRIDAGSPIIDAHGNVLSGNGRTLALQRAAELHPDKYAEYKASIRAQAREAGIDPAAVDKMQNPVLVRRLTGDTDTAAFAREANSSGTLRMSPLEQAKVDATTITNPHMLKLHVEDGVDIDRALRSKDNKPFIDDFLKTVPANERANLLTRNGELNQMGLYRVKAAVYTRAFPGAHGERMAESMLESLDPDVKQIQNGISGGLPALSRAQSLIRSGQREHNLDISEDLAKTVDVYARIKDNVALTAGTPASKLVAKYLGQSSMFGRELNDDQERLLVHIDKISNSPVKVRTFLQKYARIVENEPQPGQASLFGDAGNLTRAQLFDALLADESGTKAMSKATRIKRDNLPFLPPVRKRGDYSDVKPGDLVMALFHDRIAPRDAMQPSGETKEKSFLVYKDHAGQPRWIARTTTAYRDRDGEIISEAALDADSQRMMASKQFGPLRYWHIGQPDPLSENAPWGPGVDIGTCDYSVVIGRTRIESGTFHSASIARKMAAVADDHEMSPGFLYTPDQPDSDGVFTSIRTFERSPVPRRYARASNLFTGFAVKEHTMELPEMERRFKAMYQELGLTPEQGIELGQQLLATEKAAQAQGVAFKEQSAPDEITINGVVYAVKAAPPMEMPPMNAPDVETKAPEADALDPAVEEPAGEEADAGDYIGDMSTDDFKAMLAELLAPVLKMQDMVKSIGDAHAELKGMYGGVAQKDAGTQTEIASLKARLAQIEGDQPAVILPDEVSAALKSAGPASTDPEQPDVPADPNRPLAALAARTMPALYRTGPAGEFAGWTPPPNLP